MIQFIKNLFNKPTTLTCGGFGLIEVIVHGKVCGSVKYRRPTSDEKLDYVYQVQNSIGTELQLKEIKDASNKGKKCHEIFIRDLSVPYAEKIFLGTEGFKDKDGKSVSEYTTVKQFNFIKEYWSHVLVDLVAIAYATEGTVKKKY